MDTRTPRTLTGDRDRSSGSAGFDDAAALSMVKVPSDPAQIPGSHAVFRVQFPTARPARAPRVARFYPVAASAWEVPPPVGGELRALDAGTAGATSTAPAAGMTPVAAGAPEAAAVNRGAPVVWTGKSAPGDPVASGLLQAVRSTMPGPGAVATGDRAADAYDPAAFDAGATQILPRIDDDADATTRIPVVGAPRGPVDPPPTAVVPHRVPYDSDPEAGHQAYWENPRTAETAENAAYAENPEYRETRDRPQSRQEFEKYPRLRQFEGEDEVEAYGNEESRNPRGYRRQRRRNEHGEYGTQEERGEYGEQREYPERGEYGEEELGVFDTAVPARRRGNDSVRHAYYPGRRMNLGVVLLPLRIFLGFISIYAGMGKLCDPVYFDGGSAVPWSGGCVPCTRGRSPNRCVTPRSPHPVGAGLTFAFLQVIVGVLTVLGLWQRFAAVARRAAVRGAARHRQLAERPRLRRARHHLPRRLVLRWSSRVLPCTPSTAGSPPRPGAGSARARDLANCAARAAPRRRHRGPRHRAHLLVGALLGARRTGRRPVPASRATATPRATQLPGATAPRGLRHGARARTSPSGRRRPPRGRTRPPTLPPVRDRAARAETATAGAPQPSQTQGMGAGQAQPVPPRSRPRPPARDPVVRRFWRRRRPAVLGAAVARGGNGGGRLGEPGAAGCSG